MTQPAAWPSRARSTHDPRFWLVGLAGTAVAAFALGIPTGVIANPWFIRMTPTEGWNFAVWLASAPLIGLLAATYLAPVRDLHPATDPAPTRVGLASVGAFLAIGCPVCNKVVVGLLGVSGALSVFAPLQPVIGVASVGLLAVSLAWRLRQRARGCPRCTPGPAST